MKSVNSFTIYSKLPSLNDYIDKCRNNKYTGAKYKKDVEDNIAWFIISAKAKGKLRPTKNPVKIHFEWHEKTKKRDPDNIASAKKFILYALQKQKIIVNDNRKYIKGFSDDIVDDIDDFVVITIYDVA